MADGDVRKWCTVVYDAHTRFQITATLNDRTWKWDATIAGAGRGAPIDLPADINLSAGSPNRCLGKATEWVLGALDRGEIDGDG